MKRFRTDPVLAWNSTVGRAKLLAQAIALWRGFGGLSLASEHIIAEETCS
jgi:hypothetical protein